MQVAPNPLSCPQTRERLLAYGVCYFTTDRLRSVGEYFDLEPVLSGILDQVSNLAPSFKLRYILYLYDGTAL
jgi:hypothetical protein